MLRLPVIFVILLVLLPGSTAAQTTATASAQHPVPGSIAQAMRVHALSKVQLDRLVSRAQQQRLSTTPRRSAGRIVLGAAVGAAGGFFAGGYLGAWIDGDCGGCDDPGLKGALIGAPIGAVTGGILGGKFLF
jgi:hypothetical protein